MAISISSVSSIYALNNMEVSTHLHKASVALRLKLEGGDKYFFDQKYFYHINEAQRLIKASLPIDYTPKGGWSESDPWFDSAPTQQEIDEEDTIVSFLSSSKYPTWMDYHEWKAVFGQSHCQSKSKAKWQRSGRAARVLSNR